MNMRVISGSHHKSFSNKLEILLELKPVHYELSLFKDGEISFQLLESLTNQNVCVIQCPSPRHFHHAYFELFIILKTLHQHQPQSITLVIPYLGYSRQDRAHDNLNISPLRLIADLISSFSIQKLVIFDLHSLQSIGYFSIPVTQLSFNLMIEKDMKERGLDHVVLVSPDLGGVQRAQTLSDRLNLSLAMMYKKRLHHGGSKTYDLIGDVKDKHCVIIDDIVDSGGTLIQAANLLKERGATSVEAYATHGIFSEGALPQIDHSCLTRLTVSDTLPTHNECPDKIKILSIIPFLKNQIFCEPY